MSGIGAGEDPRGAAVPCRGAPGWSWLLEVEPEGNARLRVDSMGNARLRDDTGGYCQMPVKKESKSTESQKGAGRSLLDAVAL